MENEKIHDIRHSLAHVLAVAVRRIYGAENVKLGIGPVIENGFYYDFDLGDIKISEDDLPKIEKEMRKVIAEKQEFIGEEKSLSDAVKWGKSVNQPYKVELLSDLEEEGAKITFYTNGDFTDLCRGGHVENTGDIPPDIFKLTKVAGAYWRGSEKNPMLQRVYGVAFELKQELKDYLTMLEEAKKRDHRKLGQELELFFFHKTSPGMPYWLPNGVTLYNELINFWRDEHSVRGYQEIVSPILNKKELYETSGHFGHYWENMFTTKETDDGEIYGIKAMNCPNAMVVFGSKSRSYRELPLRLGDTDVLHRFELSGALNGLFRVREFRQDDAHIFVSEDQIGDEYERIFEITERFYSIFGMEYSFRLGTRPDEFMGDAKLWDKAEGILKEILESNDREYAIEEGDGAFYGPKIDILMKDALGRSWQMGTIQLDFQQPLRFGLKYVDSDGSEKTPIVIHRVIYGSLERFIGILIEHTAGKFPVWLSPEQLRIIKVKDDNKEVNDLCDKIMALARENRVRIAVDDSNNSVGKKIRDAEVSKIPYSIVVGEKEAESGMLPLRIRSDLNVNSNSEHIYTPENLIESIASEMRNRVSRSAL